MDMDFGLNIDIVREHTDMNDLQYSTGCSGASCDIYLEEFMEHPKWFCNGESVVGDGGDFRGHVFPGVMFLIWATHWLFGATVKYHRAKKADKRWESSSTQQVLWYKGKPVESIIKVCMPLLAMTLELWLAHPGGYRLLVCASGEVRAGHFVGNHLGNWAHAFMYIGFIVSGIVDLLSLKIDLPKGVNEVFLGNGFIVEALLMGLHKKHTALDVVVHVLLTVSMLSSGIFCFLEAAWPHTFLFSAGRIASVYLQGFWFIGTAHIMYKGLELYSEAGDDLGPAMFTPIIFVVHCMSIVFIMFSAFLLGHFYFFGASSSRRSTYDNASCGGHTRSTSSSHRPGEELSRMNEQVNGDHELPVSTISSH